MSANPYHRFAICYVCSDGIRGPIPGIGFFEHRAAAERRAARLHAAKPFISYGVMEITTPAPQGQSPGVNTHA